MKVAIFIAKFSSGWRTLAVGEDIGGIKAAYKAVRGEGVLVHENEVAEIAMLFDSAGNMRRKFLRSPVEAAALAAGKEAFAAGETAKERKLADAAAKAEGSNAARALAEKAVALVTSEIAGAGDGAEVITREDAERIHDEIERLQAIAADRATENEKLRDELARLLAASEAKPVEAAASVPSVPSVPPEAPVAPAVTDAAPAAPLANEPDDSGDAAERFGAGKKPAAPTPKLHRR